MLEKLGTCVNKSLSRLASKVFFLENATVRGRAWYKLLDAPVLTLDVTVPGKSLSRPPRSASEPGGNNLEKETSTRRMAQANAVIWP